MLIIKFIVFENIYNISKLSMFILSIFVMMTFMIFFMLFFFLVILEGWFEAMPHIVFKELIGEIIDKSIAEQKNLGLFAHVELCPDLHSKVEPQRGIELMRNKTNTVDLFGAFFGLP